MSKSRVVDRLLATWIAEQAAPKGAPLGIVFRCGRSVGKSTSVIYPSPYLRRSFALAPLSVFPPVEERS